MYCTEDYFHVAKLSAYSFLQWWLTNLCTLTPAKIISTEEFVLLEFSGGRVKKDIGE